MGIGRFRDQVAFGHLKPLLADDEQVLVQLHVRAPGDGRRGKIALTRRRCLVHWGMRDRPVVIGWDQLVAWDVVLNERGGPVLTLESDEERVDVRLPVTSARRVRRASRLLAQVREHAPPHVQAPAGDQPEVQLERRSLRAHTRRVAVTVVGLTVVLVGLLFASPFVPGPGALTVLAGLAILAKEFDWASDVHQWLHRRIEQLWERRRQRRERRHGCGSAEPQRG